MKCLKFIASFIFLAACTHRQRQPDASPKADHAGTIAKPETAAYNNERNWQEGFGLTHDPHEDSIWGKPVQFYIGNPRCSPVAINFYTGQFRPADNDSTAALLQLATSDDDHLRPFYRWCLNKTIQIQDGALAEYTGVPARQYAEKFPKEFFEYMDYDTSGSKYLDWVQSILYSGYYEEDDYKKPKEIRRRMTQTMKGHCMHCSGQLKRRIDKFAADCFP